MAGKIPTVCPNVLTMPSYEVELSSQYRFRVVDSDTGLAGGKASSKCSSQLLTCPGGTETIRIFMTAVPLIGARIHQQKKNVSPSTNVE